MDSGAVRPLAAVLVISALEKLPHVIAVRAAAPGLTIGPVSNPAFLAGFTDAAWSAAAAS